MLQWNGWDPGVVGAVELLFPGGAGASKALPLSSVTVRATPSMLCTPTVAPGLTKAGVMNAKSWIVMTAAVDVGGRRRRAGAGSRRRSTSAVDVGVPVPAAGA